jgi:hypothetical protein
LPGAPRDTRRCRPARKHLPRPHRAESES